MSIDPLDPNNLLDKLSGPDEPKQHHVKALPLGEVPVFNCLVYVSANAGGGVRARVANLAGIEFTAESERAALGKIVGEFKKQVGQMTQSGTPIPWIEPPVSADPGEQKRFIPVHL